MLKNYEFQLISFFPFLPRQEDDALQFLSQEEQECLKFFEKTIDSLDESPEPVGGPPTSNPIVSSSHLARHPSPKDQDIIYLVRPEPDPVPTKEPIFNPSSPGRVQPFVLVAWNTIMVYFIY